MKVELKEDRKKKDPARPRFRIKIENNHTTVYVNNSSHLVMNACKRKAFYYLEHQLESQVESAAQVYGTAMHKALELHYMGKPKEECFKAFDEAGSALASFDKHDPHSLENGKITFEHYIDTYKNEKWEVYNDEHGPFLERYFEFPIYEHKDVTLVLFGTIDAVMRNPETGETYAFDFKTTGQMGDRFIRGVKPASQFSGYLKALQDHYKIPVQGMMVDGIQKKNNIAKTKRGIQPPQFLRLRTHRSAAEIEEWRRGLIYDVTSYLMCKKTQSWPMNTGACNNYSGCQYMDICSTEPDLRGNIIRQSYRKVQEENADIR